MKAIVQYAYGSADVLELAEVDVPVPRAGEVLVRVHAAGLDAGAWHLMTGTPLAVRVAIGLRAPRAKTVGMDVAGTVESVGPGVTGLTPGDEVFGVANAAFAEFAVAKAKFLAPKPAGVTFELAAAVTVSGQTALQGLRAAGGVSPGQRVLITGAGGGVGSFAVQLAAAAGATVTGVCSAAKADLVRSFGATHVIDYATTGLDGAGGRYDIILDMAGNRPLSELRAVLAPAGSLIIGGGEGGGKLLGGLDRQMRAPLGSLFGKKKMRGLVSLITRDDLLELADLLAAGTITPAIDRTFPLAEAADAMRYYASGAVRGKVVITMR